MSSTSTGLGPWRRHDFRIAWGAGLVNNTGDWVLLIALPVYVFVETGSGASTAILFVAQLLAGAIMGPIGGTLVDRWDLKHSLIGTNLAQAIAVLPLLAVTPDRIWPAYIVMAAQSALNQINNPANVALIPRMVGADELASANAALSAAQSSARLIGSPLGGLLVAWGGLAPVVILDAASFVLVAAAATFLRTDTAPLASPDGDTRAFRHGLRVVRSHHPLAPLVSIQSLSQVAQGAFVVLFVVFVVDTLGDDGSGLGLIRGVMAIGALIGAAVIARLATSVDPTTLFAAGLVGMGAVSLVFWNAPMLTTTLGVYMLLFSLSGLPGAAVSVGLFTTLQTASPSDVLGRVTGIMSAGEAIGVTTGSILAGLLVDRVDLNTLLNTQAAIYLVTGLLGFAGTELRPRSSPGEPAA
ncbi:MAG: MFS transporter, partial [Actinomycetota bacterium]